MPNPSPTSRPPAARWLRYAIAFVWLATGVLVVHPAYREIGSGYLEKLGLPAWPMYATCVFEIVLGTYVALRPASSWITWLQLALIGGFTGILAVSDPWLLASPFGVLTKNIPLVVVIIVAWRLDARGWDSRTEWLLRTGMAVIWITEGLIPKILFQQTIELQVVERVNPLPLDASTLLVLLGLCQALSGVAVLVLRGGWLSALLGFQLMALVVLPMLVSVALLELWVHPFGPLTKNVPILVGTGVVFLRKTPFLTASWSSLLLVTYEVPQALLVPRLPPETELDTRDGRALVSFVSLDFCLTTVLGVPWPGPRRFPDVNLRFYVRRGEQRGVVFIRELIPSRFVAWAARTIFHEPFAAARIESKVTASNGATHIERLVAQAGGVHTVRATACGSGQSAPADSEEHFVKERYWGFGKNPRGDSVCYRVEHPPWEIYAVQSYQIDVDWSQLYGPEWAVLAENEPTSIVSCAGSAVKLWLQV